LKEETISTPVKEVLELRLTPAQIRAAYERAQRRKKNVGGCAHYDLGDLSAEDGSDLTQAVADSERATEVK
jgi:hypothetical protein